MFGRFLTIFLKFHFDKDGLSWPFCRILPPDVEELCEFQLNVWHRIKSKCIGISVFKSYTGISKLI